MSRGPRSPCGWEHPYFLPEARMCAPHPREVLARQNKKEADRKLVASTSKTRSPYSESALPSVATMVVFPTPPASENTPMLGTRASFSGGGVAPGIPGSLLKHALQRKPAGRYPLPRLQQSFGRGRQSPPPHSESARREAIPARSTVHLRSRCHLHVFFHAPHSGRYAPPKCRPLFLANRSARVRVSWKGSSSAPSRARGPAAPLLRHSHEIPIP